MAGKPGSKPGKRRGQNEGTIIPRRDDRYEVRLTVDGRQRTIGYAKTAESAQRMLTKARRERDLGMPFISERQTLAQFIEQWLAMKKPDLKESTYKRYEALLRVHVLPTLGTLPLTKLTPAAVQRLYTARRGAAIFGKRAQRVGAATVLRVHTLLREVLESARRFNLVAVNVCENVTSPRAHRRRMHVYGREQVAAFLDAARGDRLEPLYLLALTTGMRQGEMLALHWRDVDLTTGVLRITATLYRRRARDFAFTAPKTRESERTLLLAPVTAEALRAHRTRQLEERLMMGAAWNDLDLVFTAEDGSPLDGQSVTRYAFYGLLKRAGLPRIRFHELRHTYATLLRDNGVDIKGVSASLGHSTTAITADLYTHVTAALQRQVAETADAIMAPMRRTGTTGGQTTG